MFLGRGWYLRSIFANLFFSFSGESAVSLFSWPLLLCANVRHLLPQLGRTLLRRSSRESGPQQQACTEEACRSRKLLTLLSFRLNVGPLLPAKDAKHFLHRRSHFRAKIATAGDYLSNFLSVPITLSDSIKPLP